MGELIPQANRSQIEELARQAQDPAVRRRAQILLLYEQGLPTREIAGRVGLSRGRVRYWRRRFERLGLAVFAGQELLLEAGDPAGELALDPQLEGQAVESTGEGLTDEAGGPAQAAPQIASYEDLERHYPAGLHRAEHLRDLALALFDHTRHIHSLPDSHRRLLETAILLRHLGELQQEEVSRSGYLFIVSHPQANLDEDESAIVELALRYQQGKARRLLAEPDRRPPGEREALILAALVRLASGLDDSRTQSTLIESIESAPERLVVRVSGPRAVADGRAAEKRAGLWSGLFGQAVQVYVYHPVLEIPGETGLEELLARSSPGVGPDDLFAEAGRKVLGFHFAAMLRHEDGTRSGLDIEELHDMRVATRRMRAAFDVFENAFEPKVIGRHLKGLRASGRALGRVRDLDVLLEKAGRYVNELPTDQQVSLAPVLDAWRAEREKNRAAMLAHLDGKDYLRFKEKFLDFVTSPGAGSRQDAGEMPVPPRVRHVVPEMVYARLGVVRAYEEILGSASLEQMHALRIEFKKLRYTLEFFREVLGPEAGGVIEEIKGLQDHLGDLNDADVACQLLRAFLDEWEERQALLPLEERQNPEAIVAYLGARHAERHRLMVAFPAAWQRFNRPELRAALAAAVSGL
jgi:CHAD domain-containing protein